MARQREFDKNIALERIKNTFWRLGYVGTSISDLEEATGLKKQSLYRVFKSKKQMYLAALNDYESVEINDAFNRLDGPEPAQLKFKRMFDYVIDSVFSSKDKRGCFFCNAIADQSQLDVEIGAFIKSCYERILNRFVKTLEAELPYKKDQNSSFKKASQILMSYIGLRLMIKADVNSDRLMQSIDLAIQTI
ncbi:TetR/AcrR family transcriptional regulator [Agaribacter marinus]|uniref:TetR family transcriptional regulator n=1 Tax=Agaribacter marinus TaxID=1431249 RepID=A0AA37WH94_9ALTE|nr:TetR/AcrR family transcriptional regulator [Agaribacter marinus]GLR69783.1 TetR family transcriptional regulator [Agaribacter marinus]